MDFIVVALSKNIYCLSLFLARLLREMNSHDPVQTSITYALHLSPYCFCTWVTGEAHAGDLYLSLLA